MKSYLDWPLLKMVWKFWNGLKNEYVYNLSLWILITQCNYTYLYVYVQTFHTILQCKFSKETLNSIKAKVAVSLEPTESDYFKMNFVGSFSIDSDSIQLLIYQISANFIWQKKWRRHLENQPICLIPDCQHQPAQTLKGCLQIFYYIKMAQIWHRGSWILSLSILKDPTKFILK